MMLERTPSLLARTVIACKMHSSVAFFISVLVALKMLFLEAVKAMGGSIRTTLPPFKSIVALTPRPLGTLESNASILPIHRGIYFGGANGMGCNILASFFIKLKRSPVQRKSSFFSSVKDICLVVLQICHSRHFGIIQLRPNTAKPLRGAILTCHLDGSEERQQMQPVHRGWLQY